MRCIYNYTNQNTQCRTYSKIIFNIYVFVWICFAINAQSFLVDVFRLLYVVISIFFIIFIHIHLNTFNAIWNCYCKYKRKKKTEKQQQQQMLCVSQNFLEFLLLSLISFNHYGEYVKIWWNCCCCCELCCVFNRVRCVVSFPICRHKPDTHSA